MTVHFSNPRTDANGTAGTDLAPSQRVAISLYQSFFKRFLDVTLVVLSAPVILPLIMLLAVLVALLTGGRPFYTQSRVGRNGAPFRMWKLRTMVKNADVELEKYLEQNPDARAEVDARGAAALEELDALGLRLGEVDDSHSCAPAPARCC